MKLNRVLSLFLTFTVVACLFSGFKCDVYADDIVPTACEHEYVVIEKEDSTCTEEGYILYRCTICFDLMSDIIEKKEHEFKTIPAVKSTCFSKGKTSGVKCADCGFVKSGFKPIDYAKPVISSVSVKYNTFTIKWSEIKESSGCQIQYSTSNKFTSKTTKTVNVSGANIIKKQLSGLKYNCNYYIRIRGYKVVGDTKKYSYWSTVIKKTTQKLNVDTTDKVYSDNEYYNKRCMLFRTTFYYEPYRLSKKLIIAEKTKSFDNGWYILSKAQPVKFTNYKFLSSNNKIAYVTKKGKIVLGNKEGIAKITVTAKYKGHTYKKVVSVVNEFWWRL